MLRTGLLVYRTFEFVRSRLTHFCIRTGKVIVVTWLGLQRIINMLHILTIRVAKFHEIALYKLAQGLTGVVIRSKSQISLGRSIDY
ncbi:hypothetical protein BDD12DRAFT_869571, partial [Trichophaea hybrida]